MAEGGYISVKCRVNGVLEKLRDCSGELHEIERRIMTDGSLEERVDFLSIVREMLGALETGLRRVPENQTSKEVTESRSKRMRSRRAGDDPESICTHTCVHHPEIVNPGLGSKLTEDLVALVFARLPIPRIIELRKSSEAWAAMSASASFRGAFAEVNPKLFGLLGWNHDIENFYTRILDAASKEWHAIELDFPYVKGYKDSFPIHRYRDSLYACDGGLMCLVPEWEDDELFDCVVVCNPLTDVWRKLPNLWEVFDFHEPFMVQLVTDELFYRVILVYTEKLSSQDGAFVYDSRARSWSVMSSGLVYSRACDSLMGSRNGPPIVFDCATKRLFYLDKCAAVQDLKWQQASILKDHLFVLHAPIHPDSRGDNTLRFVISEFTWDNSRTDLRKVNDYAVEVALRPLDSEGYAGKETVEIFTSNGFILSGCNIQPELKSARPLIKLYDTSDGRWRDLPPLSGDAALHDDELLGTLFMCELRWDAHP